ncbi:hypothetical protein SLS56_001432 [Neofusicoccum ribis]|uniref:Uncharacterized protein n=1 Tax=Neofusicoccum ribis TaxID=45134 RepID=A0ABR3T953_9PEZI
MSDYKALVEERDHEVREQRFKAKLWEENNTKFTLWCRNTQMDREIKKLEADLKAVSREGGQDRGEGKLCELHGENVTSGLSTLDTGFPTNTNAS